MPNENIKIGTGLEWKPRDPRNLSFARVFGVAQLTEIPENFLVDEPLAIEDQGLSDQCTAEGSCAVSEDQEMVRLCRHYTFFKTKVEVQKSPESWGAPLLDAVKTHQKFGALERIYCPWCNNDVIPSREEVLNPENWDKDQDAMALEHLKDSYFECDGPYDTFDNLRSALWMNRQELRSVFTGCWWQGAWQSVGKDGIIPMTVKQGDAQSGHAFKAYGWKKIGDETYLVCQLSNGDSIGDKGTFYFPRNIVNDLFVFGSFTFKDISREKAEFYNHYRVHWDAPFWEKVMKVVPKAIGEYITSFLKLLWRS